MSEAGGTTKPVWCRCNNGDLPMESQLFKAIVDNVDDLLLRSTIATKSSGSIMWHQILYRMERLVRINVEKGNHSGPSAGCGKEILACRIIHILAIRGGHFLAKRAWHIILGEGEQVEATQLKKLAQDVQLQGVDDLLTVCCGGQW